MALYIAGPMRGHKWFNFPAFDEARDRLADLGHECISPADIDRWNGFDPYELGENWDWTVLPPHLILKDIIARDLDVIKRCDQYALLDGWETSKGSCAEKGVLDWSGAVRIDPSSGAVFSETVEQEAHRLVYGARQADYGHPLDNWTAIALEWSRVLGIDVSAENAARCMIGLKKARELTGRPKRDNLVDQAGYELVVKEIISERARRARV